ncbi:2-C-methyl-D-erythritol 4-phosphate cytidylyltransferase [Pseudobutyrivibrio sp. UC1225]|uniref:IspD/TarI family cytidylyltransferase n=1 Tax=Pseudobutyrivibrio sp. UC1225 TaxID=1798185 RepID=UPI0008E9606A|nr:IspD/TarI family cytidylyltransferase [Pseudobutyrivibrio sp. UC1225]SFO06812.1 2-C-methyl-D-erythritol 4-phosphate cytidylyltransferase [Pseudobutyrivibrio sp. UC1225]
MTVAILLSGGKGSRMGTEIPKQYITVEGVPILVYCLETLNKSKYIDKIQIVADKQWHKGIIGWLSQFGLEDKFLGFSAPGENRQESIWSGLNDVKRVVSDDDYVFIHDGARPLLSQAMIEESIRGMNGYDGVIPVLPMKDTVYMSKDGECIDSLLKRDEIYAGQAPETFVYGKYFEANKALVDSGEIKQIVGSTEPAVMAGMRMHLIAGDERNFKITTKVDLERFHESIIAERSRKN